MAYETSERDIMKKPPRKYGQRLVTWTLLLYSYLIAGGIVTVGCFIAYCHVFWNYGISIEDLPLTAGKYWLPVTSETNLTAVDAEFCSNGNCYGPVDQKQILGEAAAAWYITIVMSQVRLIIHQPCKNLNDNLINYQYQVEL